MSEATFRFACGVDEAGRGPLAGAVFAAAVILGPDHGIDGLADSKKLSEKNAMRWPSWSGSARWPGRWRAPRWRKSTG